MIRTTKQSFGAAALPSMFLMLTAACQAAAGSEKVTVLPLPEGGQPLAAKCDAQGTIHVLYRSTDGPRYAHSADNGQSFNRAIAVVEPGSRQPGLEFSVWDLAIGKAGSVHVALSTNAWKLKLPQEEWAYFYARLGSGAKSFEPLRNINRKPSEGFSLAADGRGTVTACWLSDKLYANVSHDDGKSFGPNVELDATFNPCNCCTTSCAYGADGTLAILYREETNDERDMFVVSWKQAANQVHRTRVSGDSWHIDACPMTYYAISACDEGFVAAWPTRGEIFFARLDRRGKPLFPEVKTAGASGMRTGVLALSDSAGNTLAAWTKDSQLSWQVYDERGRPAGAAGTVETSGKGVAGVLARDGRFVLFH